MFSGNPSQSWQGVSYGLELLKKGLIWRIANGQKVRIWRDRWVVRGNMGSLVSNRGRCRLKWVSDLLDHNGHWDMVKLQQFFLPMDIHEICKIHPSPRLGEDFLAWAPERSGLFYVRSAYWLAVDEVNSSLIPSTSNSPDGRRDIWKLIWSPNPKCSPLHGVLLQIHYQLG